MTIRIPVPTHLITGPLEVNRITADLVLWIPRPPDNANNRGHWAKATSAKRLHQHELGKRVTARLMPGPPALPFSRARIAHQWYYQPPETKRLDPDNAQRRLKHVVDWLVTYGYLAGDTDAHVSWAETVQIKGCPPADAPPLASVCITLTPLQP